MYFFLAVLLALPLLGYAFLLYNHQKLGQHSFEAKYGALYEDVKTNSKMTLAYQSQFMVRRVAFSFLATFFVGQSTFQLIFMILSMLMVCSYILHFRPLESERSNRLEVVNELTGALLLYHVVSFSAWNRVEESKDYLAFSFNGFVCLNMFVHFYFLIATYVKEIKQKVKDGTCCCCRSRRKSEKVNAKKGDTRGTCRDVIIEDAIELPRQQLS